MADKNQTWALYNALKFWTLYNLSEHEVRLLLLTFSDNEIRLAKICKMHDSRWESVNSAAHSDFLKPENKYQYQGSHGYPSLELNRGESPDTAFFNIKSNKVLQPRLHNRYEKSVKCVVESPFNKTITFATQTIDLSDGGLYFKEILPDWVSGYFVVNVENRFRLLCSLVEDQKEKNRVQIVSEDSDANYIAYRDWLAANLGG